MRAAGRRGKAPFPNRKLMNEGYHCKIGKKNRACQLLGLLYYNTWRWCQAPYPAIFGLMSLRVARIIARCERIVWPGHGWSLHEWWRWTETDPLGARVIGNLSRGWLRVRTRSSRLQCAWMALVSHRNVWWWWLWWCIAHLLSLMRSLSEKLMSHSGRLRQGETRSSPTDVSTNLWTSVRCVMGNIVRG